jgi:hypothetical protein
MQHHKRACCSAYLEGKKLVLVDYDHIKAPVDFPCVQ